ncbi:MAG: hypothetical protein KGQ49_01235, partial [Verrucomicrobia bacterium]|nr:hypothetical protein [Verrucomicrobiota bacterium]
VLTLSGIVGGGTILSGALFALAGVAAFYSYCCREAESLLRTYQVDRLQDLTEQHKREQQTATLALSQTARSA